jgi:hypothetical protein
MAGFDDDVIVKGGMNTPNFSNSNLLHSLLSLLSTKLGEDGSCLNFRI